MKSMNALATTLSYQFCDHLLLDTALTHPSFSHETGRERLHNQRLEFLGDAVLNLIIAESLFALHPDWDEGRLSVARSRLTDQGTLAGIARTISLGDYLKLGRGEELTGGREKDSILADALESVIAAVYYDGGLDATRLVVRFMFRDLLGACNVAHGGHDPKSRLQEILSSRNQPPPRYILRSETGPPHDRTFTFDVLLEDAAVGSGTGKSKKSAQQEAALNALSLLEN